MTPDESTKNFRPWWWWVNPWLYIKRRDIAYDTALDTLRELCLDVEFPERKSFEYPPKRNEVSEAVASRCAACGRRYIRNLLRKDAPETAR